MSRRLRYNEGVSAAKRVLLVHTSQDFLGYLRKKLSADNMVLDTALGGEESLARLEREKFDLILSALEMPRPHALDLVAKVQGQALKTPLVFLSMLSSDASPAPSSNPVLERPILLNRLYELIETVLSTRISWRERRNAPRISVRLDLRFQFQPVQEKTIAPVSGKTLDLSISGCSFERTMCSICTGYEKGDVHTDCVLYRYSMPKPISEPLDFSLQLSDREGMVLRGKIVYTVLFEGTTRELIGVQWVDLSNDQRATLDDFIQSRQVAEESHPTSRQG